MSARSAAFHALNVGYVLSERPINFRGMSLVFTEAVNVYRDTRALPRAFTSTMPASSHPRRML